MSENLPLSPQQVSQVLQRASEIDAGREGLSEDELVRVALEAGIASQAVEAAIREVRGTGGGLGPATPQPVGLGGTLRSMAVNSVVGASLGFLALTDPTFTVAAAGTALLVMLFRAVQQTDRGRQLEFQLGNSATWLSAFIGGSIVAWSDAETLVLPTVILWVVSSVIGVVLGWIRRDPAANQG